MANESLDEINIAPINQDASKIEGCSAENDSDSDDSDFIVEEEPIQEPGFKRSKLSSDKAVTSSQGNESYESSQLELKRTDKRK